MIDIDRTSFNLHGTPREARVNYEVQLLALDEGGLHHDPDDPGGRTCLGISQVHNPKWKGWEVIDDYRQTDLTADEVLSHAELSRQVYQFYDDLFTANGYHDIQPFCIAHIYGNMAVNIGQHQAVKQLQRAYNLWRELTGMDEFLATDGKMGALTKAAITENYRVGNQRMVILPLYFYWTRYYKKLCDKKSFLRKYYRGWNARAFRTTADMLTSLESFLDYPDESQPSNADSKATYHGYNIDPPESSQGQRYT